jgi:hypothetical protein
MRFRMWSRLEHFALARAVLQGKSFAIWKTWKSGFDPQISIGEI